MKVVIPMAGSGQRFIDAGYKDPKPLIRLSCDGRMIIEHVLDMFTDLNDEFIFICNERHLAETNMAQVLNGLRPDCTIVPIAPHKLGPVYTLLPAFDHIHGDEEVIVAYCDGTLKWDRAAFMQHVVNLDGCLFTHIGFHPHTLSTTKMAFVRDVNGQVMEVKEKASFTDNPFAEHASSGVYYFKRGADLKKYSTDLVNRALHFNGEYYVTLVYNLLINDGLRVGYFDTRHVAILGTPHEVQNFEAWAAITRNCHLQSVDDLLRCYDYWEEYWE